MDTETQIILKSITQFRLDRVFRSSMSSNSGVQYRLMTNVELNEKLQSVIEFVRRKLKMIPIVQVSNEKVYTISSDRSLQGFSDTRFIITDTTYGLNLRPVISRETSGNLQHVPMGITKRVNQLYFPLNGRQINIPLMFKGDYFEKCLNDEKYEFILDKLAVQFEPYEKGFHDISSKVYMHINKCGHFDLLRSTRHFGPMVFFLAWHNCIDDVLCDMIKRNYIKNCVEVIALMYKLNGVQKDYRSLMLQFAETHNTAEIVEKHIQNYFSNVHVPHKDNNKYSNNNKILLLCVDFIEDYINHHSSKKNQLRLALQTARDLLGNYHV